MVKMDNKFLQKLMHQRYLMRLAQQLNQVDRLPLNQLRMQRSQARHILRPINRFLRLSEERLAAPLADTNQIQAPVGTDWTWRPDQWCRQITPKGFAAVESKTRLDENVSVFHDCPEKELIIQQFRNADAADRARFGLRFDVFRFEGSFLSLAIDLPVEAVKELKKRHLFRLDALIHTERSMDIYVRLNVKHGPNTEKMVSKLSTEGATSIAEFDLAYTQVNEQRVDNIWVDLIFENPAQNQISLHDVTFSRRPRSEI